MKNLFSLKNAFVFLGLILSLFSLNLQAAEKQTDKKETAQVRVVFQVSDDDAKKWNLTLNNVKNLQQELGAGNVVIEVVTYGPGVNMLKFESPVSDRVDEAIKSGVKIVACENTMRALKLTKADMMSTIDYVPAGIVELIKKQHEGYAYIRP